MSLVLYYVLPNTKIEYDVSRHTYENQIEANLASTSTAMEPVLELQFVNSPLFTESIFKILLVLYSVVLNIRVEYDAYSCSWFDSKIR